MEKNEKQNQNWMNDEHLHLFVCLHCLIMFSLPNHNWIELHFVLPMVFVFTSWFVMNVMQIMFWRKFRCSHDNATVFASWVWILLAMGSRCSYHCESGYCPIQMSALGALSNVWCVLCVVCCAILCSGLDTLRVPIKCQMLFVLCHMRQIQNKCVHNEWNVNTFNDYAIWALFNCLCAEVLCNVLIGWMTRMFAKWHCMFM